MAYREWYKQVQRVWRMAYGVWSRTRSVLFLPDARRQTPYAVATVIVTLLVTSRIAAGAGAIALLPFENVSGHIQSPGFIMPRIERALEERGYEVVRPDVLEPFLAEQRIRATGKLSRDQ